MPQGPDSTIFDIYRRLPVPLQNLACSLKGVEMRYQRYGKPFKKFLDFLKKSEWWNRDDLQAYQNARLQETVRHAYESVPFYREEMKERGVRPSDIQTPEDLSLLPVISKEVVKNNTDKFISERFNKQNLIEELTSGTTGQPLRVYKTREALSKQWAVWWRHRARYGLKPGDKFLTFGARIAVPPDQEDPPFWRYNHTINQVYLSTYHITPENTPAIVEWLNEEDFDFYTGYPSAMYALAHEMKEQGLTLTNRPKYVVTGADALNPAFEDMLRRTFGVPVTEQYGMVEACGNLSKCEEGNFHLDHEFCILETVDDGISGRQERMVFTGLCNPAMPLIRYDIGDYCTTEDTPCPCGRHSRVIGSIDGRVEDFIRTPDGRKAVGMNQVFEWADGAREIQVVQQSLDSITVRIVPDEEYGEHTKEALRTEFRKRLGTEVEIDFRQVESIPRSESGKYRAVISEVEPETEEEQALRDAMGTLEFQTGKDG